MRRFAPILMGLLAASPAYPGGVAWGKPPEATPRADVSASPTRSHRVRLASWGFAGRSACHPRIADRACVPLCRRGPVFVQPQPCGAMMMVVAPTVLVLDAPTLAPAEDAASVPASPRITPTAASTAYEWNPTAAGLSSPTRHATGTSFDPAPAGNANLPLLASPGLFGGPPTGSGGSSGGSSGDRPFYDYYQGPNNFRGGPFTSAPLGVLPGAAATPDSGTSRSVATPSSHDAPPGDPASPVASVPEPSSILATLTGLGLVAASAIRLGRRAR